MCQTVEMLPQCLEDSGCSASSEGLASFKDMLSRSKQQCQSLQGEGAEGSCDKLSVMGQCFGEMQNMDSKSTEEKCRAFDQLFECAESHNCSEDDILSGTGDDAMASIREARKQCNGAAAVAVSTLLMVATSLLMML